MFSHFEKENEETSGGGVGEKLVLCGGGEGRRRKKRRSRGRRTYFRLKKSQSVPAPLKNVNESGLRQSGVAFGLVCDRQIISWLRGKF